MVRITDVRERKIHKFYVDVEIDNQDYCVYIVNNNVGGIYKKLSDGRTENIGCALSELTGYTRKHFMKLVYNHLEQEELLYNALYDLD